MDFFQNDFNSTRVAILYLGHTVIIREDLSLTPATASVGDIVYKSDITMVSVSIPEIELTVVRNLTALTISFDNGETYHQTNATVTSVILLITRPFLWGSTHNHSTAVCTV